MKDGVEDEDALKKKIIDLKVDLKKRKDMIFLKGKSKWSRYEILKQLDSRDLI